MYLKILQNIAALLHFKTGQALSAVKEIRLNYSKNNLIMKRFPLPEKKTELSFELFQ